MKTETDTRHTGAHQEKIAAAVLAQWGFSILRMNYRSRFGEIDIIAMEKDVLCFIEVKYRRDLSAGYPAEAVTKRKQMRIIRTSLKFLSEYGLAEAAYRYDVVEIVGRQIRIIRNAFGG